MRPSLVDAVSRLTDIDPERDASLLTEPMEVGEFVVAGFTWSGAQDLPTGTRIYVRMRQDGQWSPWYLSEAAQDGPDDGHGTPGTEEVVTGGADAVQAAVVTTSPLPTDLTLSLVPSAPAGETTLGSEDVTETDAPATAVDDSASSASAPQVGDGAANPVASDADSGMAAGDSEVDDESAVTDPAQVPAGTSAGQSAQPAAAGLLAATTTANGLPVPVHTRSEWGAGGHGTWSLEYATAGHVIVHHTAGSNNYTAAKSAGIVKGIYYYHANTLGWGDIGYNFLVDKYGQVFEGRDGTLAAAPGKMVVAGHAYGVNTGTIGISMMGNYSSVAPPQAQLESVGKLAGWFLRRGGHANVSESAGLRIGATTKYKAGQTVTLPRIIGHRDVNYTECPGDTGYTYLGRIREIAQADTEREEVLAWPVQGAIGTAWRAAGAQGGAWGMPRSGETATAGGVFQIFDNGTAYWSASGGAHFVHGPVFAAYGKAGYEHGAWGMPLSGQTGTRGGVYQIFQGGTAYWSATSGAHFVSGAVFEAYGRAGYERGPWGMPRSAETATRGGTYQIFAGGTAYRNDSGEVHLVHGAIFTAYGHARYERGAWGMPLSDEIQVGSGVCQRFVGVSACWSAARGVFAIPMVTRTAWERAGGASGVWGMPRSSETATRGGWYQLFDGGTSYRTASAGAHLVHGMIFTAYGASGYEHGSWGFPVADEQTSSSGRCQRFSAVTACSGGSRTVYLLKGAVRTSWEQSGGVAGSWGLPLSNETPTKGGVFQLFQKGTAYWSASGGAHFVHGAIFGAYGQAGYEHGIWGMPLSEETATSGGVYQIFRGGTAYWSPSGGAHFVHGAIFSAYARAGYERGVLGMPVTDERAISGGVEQRFVGGTLTWNARTGRVVTTGTDGAESAKTVFRGVTYDPGNLISDQQFFNSASMNESEIRSFLRDKNARCVGGNDGTPCLKDYVTATTVMDTPFCGAFAAGSRDDAAAIVFKASRACGINPQVLLVMLQKEQGLVLGSGPMLTKARYEKALGFACPDNGGCNSGYAGLASQIYYAASRLVEYGQRSSAFRYRAGQTTWIAYNPITMCGGDKVTIRNRATAALYNYTPYQPNAAAMANLTGSGDSCSTYGNRNFWRYFITWFVA